MHLTNDQPVAYTTRFRSYVQTRKWNFTDVCNNTSLEFVQVITVRDTTAPVIATVANSLDATLECSDSAGIAAALAQAPTATDNCGAVTIHLIDDQTAVNPLCANAYVQTRKWNFTDVCNNTSLEFVQVITVRDTTAPVIASAANSLDATLECSDSAGIAAALAQAPTATDSCEARRVG